MDREGGMSQEVSRARKVKTRRKERDFESDASGEETSINVVVRCRGRNKREVHENSNVVVMTEGVNGKLVQLMMGPNTLSNKTYNFDRVFSPAADQSMIFDDVVKPILEEMLAGYNCTIFAYGQTGTGKTYTMSGDMNDTFGMLSDAAGIIPRALQGLFNRLEMDSTESCVKVSFIELYNEELRDLISIEEVAKLRIYDSTSRKGHTTTLVQGIEEKHIKTAAEGIKVLQAGSLKRQVAATKCNDLSSRSHTVFTVTAYVHHTAEDGADELVQAGKLNLVDLAGSENIQRSGAESKRATEAGLINKSLLTLGRVINALVDRNAHIPYRESKLTRLLQDSLGGRTKTCILATISPAKSNLEETISTLEYAFRAKNIRNKPQLIQPINKKMLLKDFADEIEKLKGELICHRQRNGVYLTHEAYEDIIAVSESRRIALEEQSAKLDTLDANLRNKVQEMFTLTTTVFDLKKDNEGTRTKLDETMGALDQKELVLTATRKTLCEETQLRKAQEKTENDLADVSGQLISTLQKTINEVGGLHERDKRMSDLQALNRRAWNSMQGQVSSLTSTFLQRVTDLREEQIQRLSNMSSRMQTFVREELGELSSAEASIDQQTVLVDDCQRDLLDQGRKSEDDLGGSIEEISLISNAVKQRVGQISEAMSATAGNITINIHKELNSFHDLLRTSYSTLGEEFRAINTELMQQLAAQISESERLRRQIQVAAELVVKQNETLPLRMQKVIEYERQKTSEDRQQLMSQVAALINVQAGAQESRLSEKTASLQNDILEFTTTLKGSVAQYGDGMDAWDSKERHILSLAQKSSDAFDRKLRDDWNTANEHSTTTKATAKYVHAETIRVANQQVADLDIHLQGLADCISRARSKNIQHHDAGADAVRLVYDAVKSSHGKAVQYLKTGFERLGNLGDEMNKEMRNAETNVKASEEKLCAPLTELRENISNSEMREYEPTGDTPSKSRYQFPTEVPRTLSHDILIAGMNYDPSPSRSAESMAVLSEIPEGLEPIRPRAGFPTFTSAPNKTALGISLQEKNSNLAATITLDPEASSISLPPKNVITPILKTWSERSGRTKPAQAEGKENTVPDFLSNARPRKKHPRLR